MQPKMGRWTTDTRETSKEHLMPRKIKGEVKRGDEWEENQGVRCDVSEKRKQKGDESMN